MTATTTAPLGITKTLHSDFDSAIDAVTAALKRQGFGVLSDIDVTATLEAKIGAKIEPYRILGACNPHLAHQALGADRSIGLLLPCNVVVREVEPGSVEVSVVDPETLFALAPEHARAKVPHLPSEARAKLAAALESLTDAS